MSRAAGKVAGAMADKYAYSDLGHQDRGTRVQVTLSGNAANVFLVDNSNYSNYRAGRSFRYTGGLAKQSPVVLVVPSSGHWYAVVDLRGLSGNVNASFKVLPGPLPPLRQSPMPSLSTIRQASDHLSATGGDSTEEQPEREWDVFISHATEEKDEVVRP